MLTPNVRPIAHQGASPYAPTTIVKRYALHIIPAAHGSIVIVSPQNAPTKLN